MKKDQILKILKVTIITTFIMLLSDVIFSINAVNNWFNGLITNSSGWVVFLIIWLIMFLQVTVLNVPAYVVLSACVSVGIKTLSFAFIGTVITAYMAGCLFAYWLGYKWGAKAIKWCAGSEQDYQKWSDVLNKKGKWWYLFTVIFPFFPDDLLCLVAGAVKLDFWFYFISNLLGRSVELVWTVYALQLVGNMSGGFPIMPIVWGVALLAEIITYFIFKHKKERAMNLMIIGDDTEQIAKDIWMKNTNYAIININEFSKDLKHFIKNKEVILTTTPKVILNEPLGTILEFLKTNHCIPLIVSKSGEQIYYGLSSEIEETLMYVENEENKDYDKFIEIAQGYLFKRK